MTIPDLRPILMLPARMVWDKGVGEFLDALRFLKQDGHAIRGVLVGRLDPESPTAIQHAQLIDWMNEGVVEWWGHREDMPMVLHQADIIVLPSYREGFPKVLAEAAACGKPVVTTNVPGCRDVVVHGLTGLLVPVRDSGALAQALLFLLTHPSVCAMMGLHARARAEREFGQDTVIQHTLGVYQELLDRSQA